jgi:hypothetical protein
MNLVRYDDKMGIGPRLKYSFLNQILIILDFSTDFQKKKKEIKNFMKILPLGSRVVQFGLTDRQTDMIKLMTTFAPFCERSSRSCRR